MSHVVTPVFRALLKRGKVALPVPEYRFHPVRKWRLDYAWPDQRLGLEVQGGLFIKGGHSTGAGIAKDHDKYNAMAVMGWRLLQVQPKYLETPGTVALIRDALASAQALTTKEG